MDNSHPRNPSFESARSANRTNGRPKGFPSGCCSSISTRLKRDTWLRLTGVSLDVRPRFLFAGQGQSSAAMNFSHRSGRSIGVGRRWGIERTGVVNSFEGPDEGLRNQVQVFQGEVALLQLPFGEDHVDHLLDQRLELRGGWLRHRARGGLHRISDHHQRRLAKLRLGARIPIEGLVELRRALLPLEFLERLLVEVRNEPRAVMLGDGIRHKHHGTRLVAYFYQKALKEF